MTRDEIAAKYGVKATAPAPQATTPESIAAKYHTIEETPAHVAVPKGEDTSNWIDRVNAVGQGLSFGFADEAGSALAATAVKAGDLFTGNEGEDWSDVYSSMMGSEADKRKTFAEHNPAENLALQVAGGLLTGGAGGAKVLGTQAVKKAVAGSALKKAAAASAVGATEGGIAGFGSTDGDLGKRTEGAALGATVGAVLPLAMTGVGKGARVLANRRVKPDLVDSSTGAFTPITIADKDGVAGSLYRDVVAESFGGGALKRQAKPFADQAERKVTALTKTVARVESAGKKKVAQSEQVIRDQADARVNQIDQSFRAQTLDAVTPAQMPPASRSLLDPENPQRSVEQLQQFWTKNGFQSAKNKTFTLDIEDFDKSLRSMFDDDPALKKAAGEFMPEILGDFNKVFIRPPKAIPRAGITSVTPPQPTSGTMTGDNLMELRNKYARAANGASDGLQRSAFRKIANKIDKMVTDRLDPESLAQYQDDMSRWEGFSTYGKATGAAGSKKGGMFTQDDWLSQTKNTKLKSGGGVLQDVAQAEQLQKSGLKKAIATQIKDNPVKQGVENMTAEAKKRLGSAKEASTEMNALVGKKPNLFRTLAATGVLGSMMPLAKDVGDTVLSGSGVARMLSSKGIQTAVAGQTKKQKQLADAIRRYDASGIADSVRIAPSAAVAGREDEFENAIFGR